MMLTRTRIVALLIAATAVTGYGFQSGHPWPPGLQQVSDTSPVLTPEAEMKTFFMPPGYHVELVASEPMIEEPILIDWDADGRLWVVEQRGYMQDLTATGAARTRQRARGYEWRRENGQEDRLP
jgi:hypothetical protein